MPKSKSGILDIIFPPRCAFCRGLLKRGESGMCAECAKSLPYTSPSERAGTDFVAACVAPLRYEGAVREALHRYKFQGVTAYGEVGVEIGLHLREPGLALLVGRLRARDAQGVVEVVVPLQPGPAQPFVADEDI